jgi:hypothetical protein
MRMPNGKKQPGAVGVGAGVPVLRASPRRNAIRSAPTATTSTSTTNLNTNKNAGLPILGRSSTMDSVRRNRNPRPGLGLAPLTFSLRGLPRLRRSLRHLLLPLPLPVDQDQSSSHPIIPTPTRWVPTPSKVMKNSKQM